jgi:hypothetical protein
MEAQRHEDLVILCLFVSSWLIFLYNRRDILSREKNSRR